MAENVVEYALRLKYEGAPAMKAAEKDARDVQKANDDAARSAKEAARQQAETARHLATATARLEDLAATGNKVQGAALHLRRLREEVDQLVKSTGNAGLGKRILGDAEGSFAKLVQSTNAAGPQLATVGSQAVRLKAAVDEAGDSDGMTKLATSAAGASTQIGIGRNQMISLKAAIGDTVGSLVAGQNPFTVILQQGPQAATALFTLDGGIKAVGASMSATLIPPMLAAAPAIAAVSVVLAGVITAYAVAANAWQTAEEDANDLARAHVDQGMAMDTTRLALDGLTQSWGAFLDLSSEAREQFALMTGEVSALDVAATKKKEQIDASAKERLLVAAGRVAQLEVDLLAAKQLTKSDSYSDRKKGNAGIADMAPKLEEANRALREHRNEVDLAKLAVDAYTEGKKEEELKAKAAREQLEAETLAKRQAADAARQRAEAAREESEALAGMADFVARMTAAQKRALAEATQDFDAFYSVIGNEGADALRDFYDALGNIVPPKALTDLEQLALLEADLALAISRGALSADQAAEAQARLKAARAGGADAPTSAQVANGVAGVANGLGGGLGGLGGAMSTGADLAGMAGATGTAAGLAAAGPIVAAIVAIVNLVTSIVPGEGETGLLDQMHDQVMEFFNDLGGLGEALGGFIVDSVREGFPALFEAIPAFIEGIIGVLPDILMAGIETIALNVDLIIKGIAEDLPRIIGVLVDGIVEAIPEVVGGLVRMLVEGIGSVATALVELFTQVFSDILGTGEGEGKTFNQGGIFDQIFTGKKEAANGTQGPGLFSKGGWFDTAGKDIAKWAGSFDTGTDMITQTGLALVHQGERIVPSSGAMSGVTAAVMGGGGGRGDVHVYMPPGLIIGTAEEAAREVARSAGRGVGSPL